MRTLVSEEQAVSHANNSPVMPFIRNCRFCETRTKRSFEVYKGKNLHLRPANRDRYPNNVPSPSAPSLTVTYLTAKM